LMLPSCFIVLTMRSGYSEDFRNDSVSFGFGAVLHRWKKAPVKFCLPHKFDHKPNLGH